jgi:hypothetical protein
VLSVVDIYNRENLALYTVRSIKGKDVVSVLSSNRPALVSRWFSPPPP